MKRYVLRIQLLEDAHFGTGLGRGAIDATTARDRDGAPVIWWTHLKGVLRTTAEELERRGGLHRGDAVLLFGWDSRSTADQQLGAVHVSSAFLDASVKTPVGGWFHVVTSSARMLNSRHPLDDTMRTDELVRAGCVLLSECEVSDELYVSFEKVIYATNRLGADRSRGALVRITAQAVPAAAISVRETNGSGPTRRLRLRLRSLDPLCFPSTPSAGNIVDSHHFIPGSALSGALVRAMAEDCEDRDSDPWVCGALIDRTISVGNAYPLSYPTTRSGDLSLLSVMPAPLNFRQSKRTAACLAIPDWAQSTGVQPQPLDATAADVFSLEAREIAEKRLNDDTYISRTSPIAPWLLYRAALSQRLRIGVPKDGWITGDTNKDDQALFSSEEIPEHTEFVAEIYFLADDETKRSAAIAAFREQLLTPSKRLRLGRGARLVELVEAAWLPECAAAKAATTAATTPLAELSLVLQSDLILRGPNLGFVTSFNLAALKWMLRTADHEWPTPSFPAAPEMEVRSIAATLRVAGFNASSGLPRVGQTALRRGTYVRIVGPADALEQLDRIFSSQASWGERQHEGYGRIAVWQHLQHLPRHANEAKSEDVANAAYELDDEVVCAKAKAMVENQTDYFAKLFRRLRKSAIYDFVSHSKRPIDSTWLDDLRKMTTHYAKGSGEGGALGPLWSTETANPRLLYYIARWAIALGRFASEDVRATEIGDIDEELKNGF